MLARGGRVRFRPDVAAWFAALMSTPGVAPAPLTPAIAIAAFFLPPPLHGDPADRFPIAAALACGVPLVIRDRQIPAYAETGHVAAIAC